MKTVYGPVPSWRLGRSLGVDPISSNQKICSFDCVYCQLGKTIKKRIRKKIFVNEKQIKKDLLKIFSKKNIYVDIITLSGTGEPTLALNLNQIIKTIKSITDIPIAILTNSTLINNQKVKTALMKTDKVIAKLDAWDEKSLKKINNPHKSINFQNLLKDIIAFKNQYTGTFCLQIMFMKEIKSNASKIAEIAKKINPDEIQINTPLRPCPVSPLSKNELNNIKNKYFKGLTAYTVYEKKRPKVKILNMYATKKRRPKI